VSFSDEAAGLSLSKFKEWYMKQSSSTDGAATAATDDDLLFFVRKNVDKVGHMISLVISFKIM